MNTCNVYVNNVTQPLDISANYFVEDAGLLLFSRGPGSKQDKLTDVVAAIPLAEVRRILRSDFSIPPAE
jgi:hypothetical protein